MNEFWRQSDLPPCHILWLKIIELNLRKKYGFNIVAIKKGEKVIVNINPEQELDAETTLIVIANTTKLGKLK